MQSGHESSKEEIISSIWKKKKKIWNDLGPEGWSLKNGQSFKLRRKRTSEWPDKGNYEKYLLRP